MTRIPYLFRKKTTADYLAVAHDTAKWLKQYEIPQDVGKTWKIFPDGQNGLSGSPFLSDRSFYAGVSGIGFFYLRLYQVTGDSQYLEEAKAAGDYLSAHKLGLDYYRAVQKKIPENQGIYSWQFSYKVGPIGDGQYLYRLYEVTKEEKYREAALYNTDVFVEAGLETEVGVHWGNSRDIVGDGGGIVYLLQMYKLTQNPKYLETAVKGGNYIEKFARKAPEGGTYYDLYDLAAAGEGKSGDVHVNFSHGSAGIVYLWAELYEATGDAKYLKLAEDIITYLDAISFGDDSSVLLPYMYNPKTGPTSDEFYLGMCGGPVGTTFPFMKLYDITGEEKYLRWVHRLASGLINAGVPEHNSWGYWGSKCICCGGPGVLEYFAWLYEKTGDDQYLNYARRTANVLIGDAYTDETGTRWYGAWDRTNPERVVSYTGFYIGAAGAAGSLLRLYAAENDIKIVDFFEYL